MTDEHAHIWTAIQGELRRTVDPDDYALWLDGIALRRVEDGAHVVLEVPAKLRGWVAGRFADRLRHAAAAVLGAGATVALVDAGAVEDADRRHSTPRGAERADVNPALRFEQFVVGEGNRFAHAAALAVAEMPGQTYNPLFLYGPPGVGKTHLLHSIGNYVRDCSAPPLTVRCTTAEAFTNAFLGGLQAGDVDRFKERFRGVDVLLVDDVQFLQSKARTEEEFFHTFNALIDAGAQVVLTCDRLPRDLEALEERLRDRFEAGLVADIAPPDLATRMTVLRKRVQRDGVAIADDDALGAIAGRIATNVRALEGALVRVVAFASLTSRPITAQLADEVLSGLYPGAPRPAAAPTVERVLEAACELFSVTRDELLSSTREARVAWPRQLAMYVAREQTGASLPAIGAAFGGRNHTTVLHAWRRVGSRAGADPEAAQAIRALSERLDADRDG
ncbi:MAG TPA: chromosomal replication initiator protein DnaA [Solirubrobacteraceae bacterium]|jgi:chromosomal replication initiator protein|nr:chromosomal replication initiator protein DnaA [Solirubrobacteraceae bacterium]